MPEKQGPPPLPPAPVVRFSANDERPPPAPPPSVVLFGVNDEQSSSAPPPPPVVLFSADDERPSPALPPPPPVVLVSASDERSSLALPPPVVLASADDERPSPALPPPPPPPVVPISAGNKRPSPALPPPPVVPISAGNKRPSPALPPPVAFFSTYDEPPSTELVPKPLVRSNSSIIPPSGGSNWFTSLRQPVPSSRRQSIGGDGLHEQNESFPNPRPSRALTDLGKLHAQPAQYSLEILYPKEPPLESTLTIDIVAVDHYDGKPDSAWSFAYPTPAIGSARKPSPAREPQVKSQSRTKAPQKGKGEPIKPIIEKGQAPTDGFVRVPAERELPPQGPAIFFSEKEPSSKIVSLTDEHQPTKDSSLLGKERVPGTPLPKITTEGGLGPNDQSAKAGFTTGSLLKDTLKTESPEFKAREKPRPVSWLNHKDMLPKAFPDARVLRFRYPIMSEPNKRTENLDSAAYQLSSRLIERRKDCPNRLIWFIGHDFGVVVIERALIRLADTVAEQSILESTTGIIFLATPLKGLESSDYFATRGDWFQPKSNPSTVSVHNTTSHLKTFKAAIEKRNIFLYRVNSINEFSAPNDSNYLRVLGLIRRFVNSRRLLTAAANEADEAVSDLIDQGVDSNVRNGSGQTALHIAIQKGQIPMARLLLGRGGADINLRDNDDQTAIHLAAEKGNSEAVDFLLRKGADVNVKNKRGFLAIDLAKGANMQKVRSLLQNPPLLDGPSGRISRNWTKPVPPTDPKGLKACENFRATLTEFFFIGGEERRNTQHPSIWEVLYGKGPESILYDGRPPGVGQATCRWFHIPANNAAWINDLFMKLKIWDDSMAEGQHEGFTPHSRYMRPQAKKVKVGIYQTDPKEAKGRNVQSSKGHSHHFDADYLKKNSFVLFMPYLNFERSSKRKEVSELLEEISPGINKQKEFDNELAGLTVLDDRSGSSDPDDDSYDGTKLESAEPETFNDTKPTSARTLPDATSDPESKTRKQKSRYQALLAHDRDLISSYLGHKHPLHVRRTLDQFHYYMLQKTEKRDMDQVALRWSRKGEGAQVNKEDGYVVMVDQLWLWVFGDTVITGFPQKWGQLSLAPSDGSIMGMINKHLNSDDRSPITSVFDLVALITTHCSNVFDRSRGSQKLELHDCFESSIGAVADEETQRFGIFYRNSQKLLHLKEKSQSQRKDILDCLFDIEQEICLLVEIKDIRDELTMIQKALTDQRTVLSTMANELGGLDTKLLPQVPDVTLREKLLCDVVDANIRDFKIMKDRADETYEGINGLLELKQKQVNAFEARSTRELAEDTALQGKTILFFTIVTILFGSLSFMTAFFALSIVTFPKDPQSGNISWHLGHVLAYIIGISSALSIPLILVAFYINPVIAGWRKFTHEHLPRLYGFPRQLWGKKKLVNLDWRRDTESDTIYFDGGDRLSEVTSASSSSTLHRRVPDGDDSWDQPAVSRFVRFPLRARGRRQRTVALPEYA